VKEREKSIDAKAITQHLPQSD